MGRGKDQRFQAKRKEEKVAISPQIERIFGSRKHLAE
jgi:hypothetical protein